MPNTVWRGQIHTLITTCLAGMPLILLSTALPAAPVTNCPSGEQVNPFGNACAEVRAGVFIGRSVKAGRSEVPDLDLLRQSVPVLRGLVVGEDAPPVPGGYGGGISYPAGQLQGLYHSELHTRLFVHPDGINPSAALQWLFTPATNRMSSPVELVGIYNTSMGDRGSLGLFARSCSEEYPCPSGEGGWQWFRDFNDMPCNMTSIVDQGGHYQTIIQYANRTRKLDDGDPPLWQNEVLLWNFCDNAWDQAYYHEYREYKDDCSVTRCGWWGPILETFGDVQPEIDELGVEDTRLYLDGVWHELGPDEAGFKNPVEPWDLLHLRPNNSFGAGNRIVLAAMIDIQPNNRHNKVNIKSRIKVAIFSTDTLDALQVDPGSVAFGPAGAPVLRYRVRDLNRDKVPDLLLYFLAADAGIVCGDTQAEVSGILYDGTAIAGTDTIQVKGCKNN